MQTVLALGRPEDGGRKLADVRFQPALEPEDRLPTVERWLDLARQEYAALRVGVELLRFDDAELKRKAAAAPEAYCDLLEAAHRAAERYKAAVGTLDCIAARLVVALTHACSGART
jgi:hypothetical protein